MPDAARRERIAVLGGGWAGCAAALTLAHAGFPVTVFEQGKTLGGRARRVVVDGVTVDNGQHLVVGAYHQTLALVALAHGRPQAAAQFHRLPLTLQPFGTTKREGVALAAWCVPAPFHLAGALLAARGLSWRDRRALVANLRALARAGFECPPGRTVAEQFSAAPASVMAALWEPLCLAALNTPPERASARVFARVLQEVFAGPASHSDFLVPATDLSSCFPEAAARFVAEQGGSVRTGVTVRAIDDRGTGVDVRTGESVESFAAAVVAVAPHQLRRALGPAAAASDGWRRPLACVDALSYEPIATVYLRFAAPLPMRVPMLRLDDRPGQWIFRHRAGRPMPAQKTAEHLYAVVISAGPRPATDHACLASAVEGQLRRLLPALPTVLWARVIVERRATFACTPGLARPVAGRVGPGLYLAGDYTEADLPATLEAATRSGVAAAEALIADAKDATAGRV